ncbi:YARHG domain-containing protein [Clostridium estertheticum]|uniref:YARHG domain-containing protein n=1 Tax=Clostridium estertheticum subsp. estertheticum TaxID=1552 RepID=A0A1J0GEM2_9CLOT|nr:YARHG domain-containing protein [Clostridium estertheticum]APC39358.1 hypothetical protein A7L45_04430 [Clostridium estertheticum subsp. estertheticum]MBZ9614626.1 YARHG domain-containing protein [Clostridium estertheticum subsp. laramiense]WAG74551.1 YARHG domain-containing protein [Clostridium estertheticum]
MYCSKCGSEIKDGANFCFKCGNKNTKQSIINPKNISTIPLATTLKGINASNEMTTSMASIKNQPNNTKKFIIIAVVIGVLSIGCISYYISVSKFSPTTTKASDTTSIKNEAIPSNKTSNTKSQATTSANKTDSYIFSKSSSENLLESDVSKLVKGDLSLARNEIFARHGFVFKSEPFKSYFNNKSWYKQNSLFKGTDSELNAKELYNVNLILKYENK